MDGKLAIEGGAPVREKFLIFGNPDIREEEIQEVVEALRSGWPGTGPRVARFEEDFRTYVGAANAVARSRPTNVVERMESVAGIISDAPMPSMSASPRKSVGTDVEIDAMNEPRPNVATPATNTLR